MVWRMEKGRGVSAGEMGESNRKFGLAWKRLNRLGKPSVFSRPMSHLFSFSSRACAFLLTVLSLAPLAVADYVLSPEEAAIAGFMVNDPDQMRPAMQFDPILSQVARERAQDMAARNYFAHTNPDGFAANYLVWEAGYDLPAFWGNGVADNYIESIAAGYASAADTWVDWMNSAPHRTHILAQTAFYQDQTSYGVGYAYSANSTYHHYWVIITAPPSVPETQAALFIAQGVPAEMTTGQTYSVSVSMRNTGSVTWTQAAGYQLALVAQGINWGTSAAPLPGEVTPGSEVTFNFTVTAPPVPGYDAFQWRMEQQGMGRFGEASANLVVPVSFPASVSSGSSSGGGSYSAPSSSGKKSKKSKSKKSKKKK